MTETAATPEPVEPIFTDEGLADPYSWFVGSLLREPNNLYQVADRVHPDDILSARHKFIYQAMMRLHSEAQPATIADVWGELLRMNRGDDAGGVKFLTELYEQFGTSHYMVEHYASLVRDRGLCHHLAMACTEIRRDAMDRVMPGEVMIEEAANKIIAIGDRSGKAKGTVSARDAVAMALDRLDARASGTVVSMTTGFSLLDLELGGGLEKGQLVTLAGRTGEGKTILAVQFAYKAAMAGFGVLYATLEMSAVELTERLLVAMSGVNNAVLRGQPNAEEVAKITAAADRLAKLPLVFMDQRANDGTAVAGAAARLARTSNLGLVVIDHLQLCRSSNPRAKREEVIGDFSKGHKELARKLGCTVLQLSQFNRKADEENAEPQLHHLRDSGSIEQDSDTVLMLHRLKKKSTDFELFVRKQRNGSKDGSVPLTAMEGRFRFTQRRPLADAPVSEADFASHAMPLGPPPADSAD